jgi:hypothetical protein
VLTMYLPLPSRNTGTAQQVFWNEICAVFSQLEASSAPGCSAPEAHEGVATVHVLF